MVATADILQWCRPRIQTSMTFRLIVSAVSLFILSYSVPEFFLRKYLLLILPITLTLLDFTDNLLTFRNGCAQTFDYQHKDKILDILTYFYTYALFPLDQNILWLTLFRTVGVALFLLTGASFWIVLFVDFVKEYMLYKYIFPTNLQYLPVAILAKYAFEWILHYRINSNYE
jgi:hypothetical protein